MKARAAAALLLGIALCGAAHAEPIAGREFMKLASPQPVSTGDRIEVREFFYYGCPVCYEAQPHIAKWLTKAGPEVTLVRVPAVFTESSASFARTFYTLSALHQIERLHWPLYDNHHFDGKQLNIEKNVDDWVASNGVDGERFIEIWHSPAITEKIEAAKKALVEYDVKGVPSFVVDGKYITSARRAGGVAEMMSVVGYLVGRAEAERRGK